MEKIYVYKEFNDSLDYSEELLEIYSQHQKAYERLKRRVSDFINNPLTAEKKYCFSDILTGNFHNRSWRLDNDEDRDMLTEADKLSFTGTNGETVYFIVEEKTLNEEEIS